MADVRDVAQYIVELSGRRIPTMKLQKLLYFTQGWNLAWEEDALFHSEFEAWKYGPVATAIYPLHRRQATYDLDTDGDIGDSSRLTKRERLNIEDVFDFYDPFNGFELAEMTHEHDSWINAYESVDPPYRGHQVMSRRAIEDTFKALDDDQVPSP